MVAVTIVTNFRNIEVLSNPFYYTGVKKMVPISDEYVCKVFFRLNIVRIPISYYLL